MIPVGQFIHKRPHRHIDDSVDACAPGHFFPFAVPSVFRFDERLVEEVREIIDMPIRPEDHVAAASAIAAIRSTFGNEFLPPKTDGPASARPCLCKNFNSIKKHLLRKAGLLTRKAGAASRTTLQGFVERLGFRSDRTPTELFFRAFAAGFAEPFT